MLIHLPLAGAVIVGVVLLSPGPVVAPQSAPAASRVAAPAATAREVLDALAKTYADCRSYRDRGTVVMTHGKDAWRKTVAFKTAFVRGSGFRFEYTSPEHDGVGLPYVVWTDGTSVRTWWFIEPHEERPESLSLAIAGATAISLGAARQVPRLFMPDLELGWSLSELVDPQLAGQDAIADADGGYLCTKITGKSPSGDNVVTIWVDTSSHRLWRSQVVSPARDDGSVFETTTSYWPELNPVIEPGELEFAPPAAPEK